MNRKPEFHLYLYTLEGYKRDVINAYTVTSVNDLISLGKDVDTYQVICCTTDLFNKGYRIFVHETPASQFEITLGSCERTTREIKMGHNIPNLILAGEFTHDDPDKEYQDFIEKTIKDKDAIQHYANCTIDLATGASCIETFEYADDDADTLLGKLYEKAYPNNGGLPDISFMDGREDVVHYD